MGTKRGSYRNYNQNRREGQTPSINKGSTYESRVKAGIDMSSRVAAEPLKHYIGERIIINRLIESNEKEKTLGGVVIGLYPHFLLIDCGNYKTTVSHTDLVLGGRTV